MPTSDDDDDGGVDGLVAALEERYATLPLWAWLLVAGLFYAALVVGLALVLLGCAGHGPLAAAPAPSWSAAEASPLAPGGAAKPAAFGARANLAT